MQIITRKIDAVKEFRFVCESLPTRSGFKHVATLFENGDIYPTESATCYYYNRTWECWCYQTVCREVVHKIIGFYQARAVERYKEKNNLKRISAEKRKEIENSIPEVENTYKPLLESLK